MSGSPSQQGRHLGQAVQLGLCGVAMLFFVSHVKAAHIVWVSDGQGVAGQHDDQGWVDLLESQGHMVNNQAGHWRSLDSNKIAVLDAADLIIVSPDVTGWLYGGNGEADQWNGIETPLITLNPYVALDAEWHWLEAASYTLLESRDSLRPLIGRIQYSLTSKAAKLCT